MKFTIILTALTAGIAMAAPAPEAANDVAAAAPQACLPASCQSFGCCSGDCGYWCRACGISYVC